VRSPRQPDQPAVASRASASVSAVSPRGREHTWLHTQSVMSRTNDEPITPRRPKPYGALIRHATHRHVMDLGNPSRCRPFCGVERTAGRVPPGADDA